MRTRAYSVFIILMSLLFTTIVQAETLKARLEWAHTVDLRVLESGVVDEVSVLEGQRVSKGSQLLILDQRDFDIEITSAQSELDQAEVKLDHAQRKFDWNTELYDQGLISENENHETEIALKNSQAIVDAASARLQRMTLARERSRLLAPLDGIVVSVDAWQGQVILPSLQKDPLIRLASATQMVARARVSADRVGNFEPGQEALVSVGNQTRPGVVYRIGAVSEGILERGVAYAVDVIIDVGEKERLRPGMFCSIEFP